jgi:hypothetical protein
MTVVCVGGKFAGHEYAQPMDPGMVIVQPGGPPAAALRYEVTDEVDEQGRQIARFVEEVRVVHS